MATPSNRNDLRLLERLPEREPGDAPELTEERRLEIVAESKRQDIEVLMRNPAFRRFAHRIMAECGVMQSVMTGNSQTFYKAGKQDFGHQVFAWIAEADHNGALDLLHSKKYGDESYV